MTCKHEELSLMMTTTQGYHEQHTFPSSSVQAKAEFYCQKCGKTLSLATAIVSISDRLNLLLEKQ